MFDNGTRLDNIDITIDDVADQIKCLDCSKSYGADSIHPILLKEGGDILVSVLHRFDNISIFLKKIKKKEDKKWSDEHCC